MVDPFDPDPPIDLGKGIAMIRAALGVLLAKAMAIRRASEQCKSR